VCLCDLLCFCRRSGQVISHPAKTRQQRGDWEKEMGARKLGIILAINDASDLKAQPYHLIASRIQCCPMSARSLYSWQSRYQRKLPQKHVVACQNCLRLARVGRHLRMLLKQQESDLVRHESLLKHPLEHPNHASSKLQGQQPMMVMQSQ
jgi:hypothetical protein